LIDKSMHLWLLNTGDSGSSHPASALNHLIRSHSLSHLQGNERTPGGDKVVVPF
jgi:hypothetical protein